MNVNETIESLGLTREQLFQFYTQYLNQRQSQNPYKAAFRAYDLFRFPKELIFFLILGLERVENEMHLIEGE